MARNRIEAEALLARSPRPYVLKNPLCSPTSPIHTILCETVEDTRSWLKHLDYAEGVFLQEYLGRREVGHIALVSGGELYSLVTNQEYKRAFAGRRQRERRGWRGPRNPRRFRTGRPGRR